MRSAMTDETVWMPRLICVFAAHIGHFVGFVVLRLIFSFQLFKMFNRINQVGGVKV